MSTMSPKNSSKTTTSNCSSKRKDAATGKDKILTKNWVPIVKNAARNSLVIPKVSTDMQQTEMLHVLYVTITFPQKILDAHVVDNNIERKHTIHYDN